MLSGHTIQSITTLHDLPRLVAELGHESLWEPLDAGTLDLGRQDGIPPEAALVGHLDDFAWYGVTTANPSRAAPRLARRLTERGRICGVFAIGHDRRHLAVSVAFDGTPVLEIDLRTPSRLATSCLRRISNSTAGGSLGIASRTAEALSGGGLGRQFFSAFRATLDRFICALPEGLPARHRHEIALLQLTRVLFLYFVQAKGWLDGSEHFLKEHVDDCLFHRRPVHRSLLLPLFFGTLNQPPGSRRGGALKFGRVPFLNGGLFEPHPLERRYRPDVPDAAWRDAFDTLFERYHFTVQEDAPGGIAPDMLGMVFEGVMEPAARKGSGTYYTPSHLVRSIVDAALAGWVGGRLGIPEVEALRRLEEGEHQAIRLLDNITILDPAVGSGAFLLGALDRLIAFRSAGGAAADPRGIVSRNLYGVDLNPAAIQLAELRLWLAVIGREPDGAPEAVEPLPNLRAFVRQGDSLSDPMRLVLAHPLRSSRHAGALAAARTAASAASGGAKRDAMRLLHRLELDTALERIESAIGEREGQAAALVSAARSPTLFGERRGIDARTCRAIRQARKELRGLRNSRRRIVEDRVVPTFDFDTHFGDVTSRGGFDLVIGNPPWVRAEGLPAAYRKALGARFRWWRSGSGRGYGHQPDLAVAFLERGWELTRPGGVLAMLVPAKIATTGYGAIARAALSERGTVLALADLSGQPNDPFDATTYPMAVVVRSHPPPAGHRPMLGLHPDSRTPLAANSSGGAPWILLAGDLQRIMQRLERLPQLSGSVRIQLGVKTGANHLFLAPTPEVEGELVRSALHGKDVREFRCSASSQIIWTHDDAGAPLATLPPGAARHFELHAATLRARADQAGTRPWCVFRAAAGRPVPRVVWADIAPRLEATCLIGAPHARTVPLNSCYLVISPSPVGARALCAWLNSTWIRAIARATADPASGGYARFNARAVGQVPLPSGVLDDPMLAALAERASGGEEVQRELDHCVGNWLELGVQERRILSEVVGVGTPRRR